MFSGGGDGTPLVPALGRLRQADLCGFEARLYRASSRATQRDAVLKNIHKLKQSSNT